MKADWLECAGKIIEQIGKKDFPAALAASLRKIAPYEYTVIFGYVGSARPLDLFDDFPPDRRRLHVGEYQAGPYLLDPFFLASRDLSLPGFYRLREIAPDRFYQGEYFKNYYEATGLAEEVGYLVDIHSRLKVVVSLMRREKRFSAAEFSALRKVWPIVDAACRQNWQNIAVEESHDPITIEEQVEMAFKKIGEGVLTPRERQVVEYTLRGHSAEAIGKIFEISPGTVRIHRRNIYLKLRINSQGELFSEFISAMLENSQTDVRI